MKNKAQPARPTQPARSTRSKGPARRAAAPSPAALWAQAVALHQAGHYPQAQALYETLLAAQPQHVQALHYAGLLAYQTQQHAQAVALLRRAIALQPQQAALHANLALALEGTGCLQEAIAAYDHAIALAPDQPDAYSNRGGVLAALEQWEAALQSLHQAIALRPDHADARFNRAAVYETQARWQDAADDLQVVLAQRPNHVQALCMHGNALEKLQQWDAAMASLQHALALEPQCASAHFHVGNIHTARSQWSAALASYSQALAAAPNSPASHYNLGNTQRMLRQWSAALASYDQAIALQPDFVDAYNNRGLVLKELGQLDAALASYEHALHLAPNDAAAHSNRGNALLFQGDPHAALASFERALAIKPDYPEALSNRGNALLRLQRVDEALQSYNAALTHNPDYADAHWNKSFITLLNGDFEHGWPQHEWRWKGPMAQQLRPFTQPLWLGQAPLAGKTILLHAEQGLGDTLQFCRYAIVLADVWQARVLLEVQPPLVSLLQDLPGVAQVIPKGAALPAFDYHCPLLSLPLACQTRLDSIPAAPSYLVSQAQLREQWEEVLPQGRPRIGLAWSGNPQHQNDRNRSLPLAQLLAVLPPEAHYISLQKDLRSADAQTLQTSAIPVHHYGQVLRDFSDTAALCDCMDWILSVDTSIVHLSAALGKPTWLLLPYAPDWRWLRHRSDSPWYPSLTLYRQTQYGHWGEILDMVGKDLAALRL